MKELIKMLEEEKVWHEENDCYAWHINDVVDKASFIKGIVHCINLLKKSDELSDSAEDFDEIMELTAKIDLTISAVRLAFKFWKQDSGTLEGLKKVMEIQNIKSPEIKEKILETSNIYKIRWDENNLFIHFNNESVYQYFDVPEKVSIEMGNAESPGSFLHHEIKGQYRYSRI